MIQLGLARISRLLENTPIPWKAIHVAGTNGKGSVCAYASAMLHASGVKTGRFTSPYLIDRWDCITIQERAVSPTLFHAMESKVKAHDQRHEIGATEFEILTATAFEIFYQFSVEVGVVEVGLGGTHDATNILPNPAVTIITKIGLDHQSYLGDTIELIAGQKAGVIKSCTICLADGTNEPSVLEILRTCVQIQRARSLRFITSDTQVPQSELEKSLSRMQFASHQLINIRLALAAAHEVLSILGHKVSQSVLLEAIKRTSWPGRLQFVNLEDIVCFERDILLDGAHNLDAAKVLGSFVDHRVRQDASPVLWLIGMSRGKDAGEILRSMLRSGDLVMATAFHEVEGMPWIKAMEPQMIVESALSVCSLQEAVTSSQSIEHTLHAAAKLANRRPIVIAGSLYLVSEVLSLKRRVLGTT